MVSCKVPQASGGRNPPFLIQNTLMKEQIEEFFNRPGINKSGICIEAGITQQYLNRILRGTQPITESFISKIVPILESYGFKAGGEEKKKESEM